MSKELIGEVVVPLYVREFQVSNATRPKYWKKGSKLPLEACDKKLWKTEKIREPDNINYKWKAFPVTSKGKKIMVDFLVTVDSEEKIIANASKVGLAKSLVINGQHIYNGKASKFTRNKMMETIKEQLRACVFNSEWGKSLNIVERVVEVPDKKNKGKFVKRVLHTATTPIQRYPIRLMVQLWDHLVDEEYSKGQDWDAGNRILPYNKAFEDILTDMKIIMDDCTKFVTGPPATMFCPLLPGQRRKLVYGIFVDRREMVLNNPQYKQILGTKLG